MLRKNFCLRLLCAGRNARVPEGSCEKITRWGFMRGLVLRRSVPALLASTFFMSCGVFAVRVAASERQSGQPLSELRYTFDIAARPLPQALKEISRTTGMSIAINRSEAMMLVGLTGRPVRGELSADEALAAVTSGTGVQYRRDNFQKFTLIAPLSAAALDANAQGQVQAQAQAQESRLDKITVRTPSRKPRRAHRAGAAATAAGVRDQFRRRRRLPCAEHIERHQDQYAADQRSPSSPSSRCRISARSGSRTSRTTCPA